MASQLGSNYFYVNSLYLQPLICNLQCCGGTLFYIDSTSTNTYTFYNNTNFTTQTAPTTLGTDLKNYYYTKTGTGKDKYYVYYPTKFTARWGYSNKTVTGDISALEDIGTGRATTQSVLGQVDTSGSYDTIWRIVSRMNASKLMGCSDWYIGSEDEMIKLRDYIGASNFSGCWCNRDQNNITAFAYTTNKAYYPLGKDGTNYFVYLIRSF